LPEQDMRSSDASRLQASLGRRMTKM